MDKVTYLKNKELLKSKTPEYQREDFCYKCYKLSKHCLCSDIISFDPFFEFIILMHPMEAKKEKMGTGRISHAFLEKSKIIVGVDFTLSREVNELINDQNAFVMYPGESSLNVSKDDLDKIVKLKNENQRTIIFLIDGTWPCAKKMMKLSKNLHSLPRISFDVEKESMFEIKEQPSKFCLSTIESIHLFLSECERRKLLNLEKKHDNMLVTFKKMIDFQIECAQDPNLKTYRRNSDGFKNPSERKPSKKWENRSIVFKG